MGTSSILPFAPVDTGLNLLSDADYLAASDRTTGNQPGVARSRLVNKALRQSSLLAAVIAQFTADRQTSNVGDGLSVAGLQSQFEAALLQFIGAQNQAVLGSSGYVKIPVRVGGTTPFTLIVQWGFYLMPAGVYTATVTLPTAYPTAAGASYVTDTGNSAFPGGAVAPNTSTLTLYKQPSNPNIFNMQWLSLGW